MIPILQCLPMLHKDRISTEKVVNLLGVLFPTSPCYYLWDQFCENIYT
mgnify:CR=1 FL=1